MKKSLMLLLGLLVIFGVARTYSTNNTEKGIDQSRSEAVDYFPGNDGGDGPSALFMEVCDGLFMDEIDQYQVTDSKGQNITETFRTRYQDHYARKAYQEIWEAILQEGAVISWQNFD